MNKIQNWTTEFKESFKDLKSLYQFLEWKCDDNLSTITKQYPIFIPVKLALKIRAQGPDGILAKEFLPHLSESSNSGLFDPIGDKEYNLAPQLIHRYKSRALFTPTNICPVQCRYCFRKNELHQADEIFNSDFEKTLQYLNDHSEIHEIIFTGGDPLTLSNDRLASFLNAFSKISHLTDIRFHSRYPVIIPSRIDDGFKDLMEKFSHHFRTISLVIHTNHIDEFDDEINHTVKEMNKLPIQVLSQSVLLKGINDNKDDLLNLINHLIKLRVKPYYLHHPDQVKGGMHFYLPLKVGRELYASLRDELPGWAIPQYMIDLPTGLGKTPAFNPESFEFKGQLLTKDLNYTSYSDHHTDTLS